MATPTTIQVLAHLLADLAARVAAFVAVEAALVKVETHAWLEFEAKNAVFACDVCIVSSCI
ncbi:MAG: hypothetical protein Q8S32_00205 [Burkholderiaceae bacterium]|nr:hypothetical protein [Burkholderiaceae bacterium]